MVPTIGVGVEELLFPNEELPKEDEFPNDELPKEELPKEELPKEEFPAAKPFPAIPAFAAWPGLPNNEPNPAAAPAVSGRCFKLPISWPFGPT